MENCRAKSAMRCRSPRGRKKVNLSPAKWRSMISSALQSLICDGRVSAKDEISSYRRARVGRLVPDVTARLTYLAPRFEQRLVQVDGPFDPRDRGRMQTGKGAPRGEHGGT